MRVLMNGLSALKPRTGVGQYVARLHAALADHVDLYPGEPWAGWARRWWPKETGGPTNRGGDRLRARAVGLVKHLGKTAVGVHFAHHAHTHRYDVYHEPNFIPFSTRLPTVVTVHDLSVLLHPEWHPADRVRHHERHFAAAVRRAEHVITVSQTVRRELVEIVGVPSRKVTAVPNGLGAEFRPSSAGILDSPCLDLPERFFLCVGTIEPRKNVLTVMRAFAGLPNALRTACPLVLVGPWGWKSEPERQFYEANGKASGIRHLGYVADADLPMVYRKATALLYPSRYEGFGLPPLEMLACGGAVLASTSAGAVREVIGDCGMFLDADDVGGWHDALARIATNDELLRPLRTAGPRRAEAFSWKRTAEETQAVYDRTAGSVRPAKSSRTSRRAA